MTVLKVRNGMTVGAMKDKKWIRDKRWIEKAEKGGRLVHILWLEGSSWGILKLWTFFYTEPSYAVLKV